MKLDNFTDTLEAVITMQIMDSLNPWELNKGLVCSRLKKSDPSICKSRGLVLAAVLCFSIYFSLSPKSIRMHCF